MRTPKWLLIAPLALACSTAHALGLGQIQVKSKPGEPLLAEIPVVSSQPDELLGLQAQLASAETFQRVGLSAPQGVVADLRFVVVTGSNGIPVIRVTTDTPVETPSVVFLMEVNWGEGRIVREFSALVDAPLAMETHTPLIEEAAAGPDNLIVRPTQPEPEALIEDAVSATEESASPETTEPTPLDETDGTVASDGEANEAKEVKEVKEEAPPAPKPTPSTFVSTPRPAPTATGQDMRVARGQTLSAIAGQQKPEGRSLNETMMALLRANPQAFIDGNINLVKAGAILRAPAESDWNSPEVENANRLVMEHVARWRSMQPVPAPATGTTPDVTKTATTVATPESHNRGSNTPQGARLEIVPAAAEQQAAKVNSGTAQAGTGNTLGGSEAEELARNKEDLITRELELEELKSQVAELEALQKDQDRLLAMKANELAEVQKQLAARQAKAAPTKSVMETVKAIPTMAWSAVGGLLVLLGLLGWRSARKRNRARDDMRAQFREDSQNGDTHEEQTSTDPAHQEGEDGDVEDMSTMTLEPQDMDVRDEDETR